MVLMENAGRAVAREIRKDLKGQRDPKVSIFCGTGNNGGDGFVVARHLLDAGLEVETFLVGQAGQLKADAATNYQILKSYRIPIKEIVRLSPAIRKSVSQADIVVDALFGVGLNRAITDPCWSVIEALNAGAKRIMAVDVPSGLDATTGKIHGVCVKAYKTVTFTAPKTGFLKNQGPSYIGKVVVADIGIK